MVKKLDEVVDSTAWMLDNDVANFVLLHQKEVLYMCMVSGILGREEINFCIDTLELVSIFNILYSFAISYIISSSYQYINTGWIYVLAW